jgi:hypothetical protein
LAIHGSPALHRVERGGVGGDVETVAARGDDCALEEDGRGALEAGNGDDEGRGVTGGEGQVGGDIDDAGVVEGGVHGDEAARSLALDRAGLTASSSALNAAAPFTRRGDSP